MLRDKASILLHVIYYSIRDLNKKKKQVRVP